MTSKEYKRLQDYLNDNGENYQSWHGWVTLYKPYAQKKEIHEFISLSDGFDPKHAFKKVFEQHSYKQIQKVSLWISHRGRRTIYF